MKRIHLISIGNYTMCHLAIALQKKEYIVSGSGVDIPEPQRTLLAQHNLMPETMGWNADQIKKGIDIIIPAPDVDKTNPELAKALEKGMLVMSFPEFIYHETKEKVRFVVSGSRGKSSVMSMMIYALKKHKIPFDYAGLGHIRGVEQSISLKPNTRIALLEGDEYPTSVVEQKPLHRFYHPQIVLLTNLIWEENAHFGSFDDYLANFKKFVEGIDRDGKYIYFENNEPLQNLTAKLREDITAMPYKSHDIVETDGKTKLKTRFGEFDIAVQDDYFLQNLNGARIACRQLGLQDKDFYAAISEYSFLN